MKKYQARHQSGSAREPYGQYTPRHGKGLASAMARDAYDIGVLRERAKARLW